jgi:hypothetical protein
MKTLDHPNVLAVTAMSSGKGVLNLDGCEISSTVTYFVMPLAGKGDLGTYLK